MCDNVTEEFSHNVSIVSNEVTVGRTAPGVSRSADTVCLEPNCNFQCKRIPELRKHLSTQHKLIQPATFLQFPTLKEFENWLSEVEKTHHCSYMRRRGWQTNKSSNSRSTAYYCHRAGSYTSNASKKQAKYQGSCKTGVECTSSIKVKELLESGHQTPMVEVEAYLQHYGHNVELTHTRIPAKIKHIIADKLNDGVSRHKIIDEIRGSFDGFSAVQRQHLISLQDIYNIEKKNGITASRGRYSCESGITAQAWIEAMQRSEDNPVLLIKYQQDKPHENQSFLSTEDFLLILQTPLQRKMLQKFAPRQFVCVDSTNGGTTTPKDNSDNVEFFLMTISTMVDSQLTDCKETQAVAWCVSNRKDDIIIQTFFNKVMHNMKGATLTPAYIIMPCNGNWHNIWTSVFGPGPRKLLASWDVEESWMQELNRLCPTVVSNSDEKSRVVRNLKTVLHETMSSRFVTLLQECANDLIANEPTMAFGEYLMTNFANATEAWSLAYRSIEAIQSDRSFKLFHDKLSKHIYTEALKRKQLDVLIKTLMKYSRDKVLTKLRKMFALDNDERSHNLTIKMHVDSLKLSLECVEQSEECDKLWLVNEAEMSEDNTKKFIIQSEVRFDDFAKCLARSRCPLRCSDCGVCAHAVSCSCTTVETNVDVMCVHVHLVCNYLKRYNPKHLEELAFPQPQQISTKTSQNLLQEEVVVIEKEVAIESVEVEDLNPITLIIQS